MSFLNKLNNKKHPLAWFYYLLAVILALALAGLVFSLLMPDNQVKTVNKKENVIASYTITSSGQGPHFRKVIIAPQVVAVGQKQKLTAVLEDEQGIDSVIATTNLDNGIVKTLNLNLVLGDNKSGTYEAIWTVDNTHETTYTTVFKATTFDNRSRELSFDWVDPSCDYPDDGTGWVIDYDQACSNLGVFGPEDSDITISSQINISNSTLVWTPGNQINLADGGQIIFSDGFNAKGSMQKGYIFVLDNDQDTVADGASTTVEKIIVNTSDGYDGTSTTFSLSGKTYTRQKNLGTSGRPKYDDCATADPNYFQNMTGYFDYDQDGWGGLNQAVVCTNGILTQNNASFSVSSNGGSPTYDCLNIHPGDDNGGDSALVNPDSQFQDRQYKNSSGVPTSWDWNCDGVEERLNLGDPVKSYSNAYCQWNPVSSTCEQNESYSAGWLSAFTNDPGCGETKKYLGTVESPSSCSDYDDTDYETCVNAGVYNRIAPCK